MIKIKKRALLWLVSVILSLSLASLFGWVVKLHRDYKSIPPEHLIGNRVSNVNALKGKGFPFSFLVISDTHNSKVGETLLKLAMNKEDVSFLIHVGDFVSGPDLWDHRFFLTNMTMEIKPPFPVFLVPGNHDIDYISSGKKQNERRVTPEIYESLYGFKNFDFIFNDCLFVICETDPRNKTSYLNYLRETLSKKGMGKKYIFVFIHHPPGELVKYRYTEESPLSNEAEFFNLVGSYKVTTCFFGHYHGYRRGETKGVNLIVLGGGGGRLKSWQSEWGKFHHLLKINVNENMIVEDMLILKEEGIYFGRTFKKWVFFNLFPITENRGWTLYSLSLFFLFWGIYSVKIFFGYFLKKEKRDGREKS